MGGECELHLQSRRGPADAGGSINGTGAAGELRRWVYGAGKANASAHGRNLPSVGATLIFLFGPQL